MPPDTQPVLDKDKALAPDKKFRVSPHKIECCFDLSHGLIHETVTLIRQCTVERRLRGILISR